jgi:uncharacterized protein YecT (DUF1311 family)
MSQVNLIKTAGSTTLSPVLSWLTAVAAVAFVAGLTDARSQPAEGRDPCLDSKTELDLRTCRREALKASQARLDRRVEALRSAYSRDEPVKARLLEQSQEAWTRYRDAQCRLLTADSASGTAAEMYLATCLTTLNDQRSGDLSRIAAMP